MNADVLVIGGGLVGAAAALALSRCGLDVAMVERQPPQPATEWDARVYAVSPGNVRWLQSLGVWQQLDLQRVQPVHRMEIEGDAGGRLSFDAWQAHSDHLAVIVENRQLQLALWQGLAQTSVDLLCATPLTYVAGRDAVRVELDNGVQVTARLVLAADGAASWTRAQAGLSVQSRAYGQLGVVANFETEMAHHATASQWFRADGVLAWLPLPGQRMSMVWSTPTAQGESLLALSAAELCAAVAAAGGQRLGRLSLLTPARAFPLALGRAERMIAPRLLLVGDAAHTVHPLAGQGVNLGFRDVRELALQVAARRTLDDIGSAAFLRAVERARAEDVLLTQASCDGFDRLFNRAPSWLAPLRNQGMSWVDRLGGLKRQLMQQAMR